MAKVRVRGRRRVAAVIVLAIACLVTLLAVTVVVAAYRNDATITSARATADAEVLSTSFKRTIVRFETDDGEVRIPKDGVLYSAGLHEGRWLLVEYSRENPEVVRVAGRSAALSLLPAGTTVLFTWLIAAPLLWWLRRRADEPPAA